MAARTSKNQELDELELKAAKNEIRARDSEARLRIVNAEIAIIEQREKLRRLKESD